ncbi:hypothetical protein KFE25_002136 [Diacronema lutheri]|uniref:RRM domain-containing protein n=1 Tax=Diacronema lutheri TaxID=2081491 RepID=A0A8J5XR47_DIALT|nr:hypothetical protein KFE25_002136 [Diacronema lutheri]
MACWLLAAERLVAGSAAVVGASTPRQAGPSGAGGSNSVMCVFSASSCIDQASLRLQPDAKASISRAPTALRAFRTMRSSRPAVVNGGALPDWRRRLRTTSAVGGSKGGERAGAHATAAGLGDDALGGVASTRGSRLSAQGSVVASAALAPVSQFQRIAGWADVPDAPPGSPAGARARRSTDAAGGVEAAPTAGFLSRLLPGHRSAPELGCATAGGGWFTEPSPASPRAPALAELASPSRGGDGRVPRLFCALVAHLARPALLRTVGLFRVSADVARVRALRRRLDSGEHERQILAELDAAGGEPHVAGALLKAFLRELPEPACTFGLYEPFVDVGMKYAPGADALVRAPLATVGGAAEGGDETAVLDELRALVAELPPAHREVLLQTCALLAAVTAEYGHNRMGAGAIATIFAPNLLWPRAYTLAHLADLGATARVTQLLIERLDEIFLAGAQFEDSAPEEEEADSEGDDAPESSASNTLFVADLPSEMKESELSGIFRHLRGYLTSRLRTDKSARVVGFVEFEVPDLAAAAKEMLDGQRVSGVPVPLRMQFAKPMRAIPQRSPLPAPKRAREDEPAAGRGAGRSPPANRAHARAHGDGDAYGYEVPPRAAVLALPPASLGYAPVAATYDPRAPPPHLAPLVPPMHYAPCAPAPERLAMPIPPGASATLYIDNVPADATQRELSHIFRPYAGFQSVRLIAKEAKRAGEPHRWLCFAEFDNKFHATAARNHVQGYRMDKNDTRGLGCDFAKVNRGPPAPPRDAEPRDRHAAGGYEGSGGGGRREADAFERERDRRRDRDEPRDGGEGGEGGGGRRSADALSDDGYIDERHAGRADVREAAYEPNGGARGDHARRERWGRAGDGGGGCGGGDDHHAAAGGGASRWPDVELRAPAGGSAAVSERMDDRSAELPDPHAVPFSLDDDEQM